MLNHNAQNGENGMLPRLSQRTYDLMRRALDAVDKDTADLITTLVASAFVDAQRRLSTTKGRAWTK